MIQLRLYRNIIATKISRTLFRSSHISKFVVTYRGNHVRRLLTVKFGILTPAVAKNPIALLKALSHAHESLLPCKAGFSARRELFGGTLTNAHMSRAKNVGGTKIAFAKNRHRIFWGEMNMKGN